MKPWKSMRSENTPNSIFVHARELLIPHLVLIFGATDTLKQYPNNWSREARLYRGCGRRLIVLSNGMARLLNGCKTEDLILMCEKMGILPLNHFRGRPGRATIDSVHLLVKTVKDAWRRGEVALLLCLGVKVAFPSARVNVLA